MRKKKIWAALTGALVLIKGGWGLHNSLISNSYPGSVSVGPQLSAVTINNSLTGPVDDPQVIGRIQAERAQWVAMRRDMEKR